MPHSIPQVNAMIAEGKSLFLAGSPEVLAQLQPGCWIGGTIPYFMSETGAVCTEQGVFVTEVPSFVTGIDVRWYDADELQSLYDDAPANGFTFLLMSPSAPFLEAFAERAPECDGFLLKPMVGWVAGVHLSQLGKLAPLVFDGRTQTSSSQKALAMHVTLPAGMFADIEIVNIFTSGMGDTIGFPRSGLDVTTCTVNGLETNFAEYVVNGHLDQRLPLMAEYGGSLINVGLQTVDAETGRSRFYAPVFAGVEYRFAAPVGDYAAAFARALAQDGHSLFSCNCILNYLFGELEGRPAGDAAGPFTFGEIAHQLVSQTLVRLRIGKVFKFEEPPAQM